MQVAFSHDSGRCAAAFSELAKAWERQGPDGAGENADGLDVALHWYDPGPERQRQAPLMNMGDIAGNRRRMPSGSVPGCKPVQYHQRPAKSPAGRCAVSVDTQN